MHRRVPIVTTIKRRCQRLRRGQVGIALHAQRDLIRVRPVYAAERQLNKGRESIRECVLGRRTLSAFHRFLGPTKVRSVALATSSPALLVMRTGTSYSCRSDEVTSGASHSAVIVPRAFFK